MKNIEVKDIDIKYNHQSICSYANYVINYCLENKCSIIIENECDSCKRLKDIINFLSPDTLVKEKFKKNDDAEFISNEFSTKKPNIMLIGCAFKDNDLRNRISSLFNIAIDYSNSGYIKDFDKYIQIAKNPKLDGVIIVAQKSCIPIYFFYKYFVDTIKIPCLFLEIEFTSKSNLVYVNRLEVFKEVVSIDK